MSPAVGKYRGKNPAENEMHNETTVATIHQTTDGVALLVAVSIDFKDN